MHRGSNNKGTNNNEREKRNSHCTVQKPVSSCPKCQEEECIVKRHTVPGTSGTIEVIVKTQKNEPSKEKVPWTEKLKRRLTSERRLSERRNSNADKILEHCSPVRTAQFIAEEITNKLETIDEKTDGPCVKRLVSDLSVALERLDVSRESIIQTEMLAPSLVPSKSSEVSNRMTQTPSEFNSELAAMQQTFETTLTKLEETCHTLETTCKALRNERDELQHLLVIERENRKRIEKLLEDGKRMEKKFVSDNARIRKDRDDLREKLLELQKRLDENISQMARDSKSTVEKLRDDNLALVKEVTDTRAELMSTVYEKNKLAEQVQLHTKNCMQVRSEIDAIYTIINKQIEDIRRPLTSSISESTERGLSPTCCRNTTLSYVQNSPPVKDAGPEVQNLFRDMMREKVARGEAPSPQIYGSFQHDSQVQKQPAESYKELPTDISDMSYDPCAASTTKNRFSQNEQTGQKEELVITVPKFNLRSDVQENQSRRGQSFTRKTNIQENQPPKKLSLQNESSHADFQETQFCRAQSSQEEIACCRTNVQNEQPHEEKSVVRRQSSKDLMSSSSNQSTLTTANPNATTVMEDQNTTLVPTRKCGKPKCMRDALSYKELRIVRSRSKTDQQEPGTKRPRGDYIDITLKDMSAPCARNEEFEEALHCLENIKLDTEEDIDKLLDQIRKVALEKVNLTLSSMFCNKQEKEKKKE